MLNSEQLQQIPLRVGFFMHSRFEELDYGGSISLTGLKEKPIKVKIRDLFEQAVRRMFTEVVPITMTETMQDWRAKNLDVVVTVGAISCLYDEQGLRERWPPARPLMFATVAADWVILDSYGKPVISMNISCREQTPPTRTFVAHRNVIVKALDAHFVKAYDNIVMTAWWRDSSWKTD